MRKLFAIFTIIIFLTTITDVESTFAGNNEEKIGIYAMVYSNKNTERHFIKMSSNEVKELKNKFLYIGKMTENMSRNSAIKFMRKEIENLFEELNISIPVNDFVPYLMPYVVIGDTTNTLSTGAGWTAGCSIMYGIYGSMVMIYKFLHSHGIYYFSHLLYLIILLYFSFFLIYYIGIAHISYLNPIPFFGTIFIGSVFYPIFGPPYYNPGKGWVYVLSLNGVKKYGGDMYGNLDFFPAPLLIFGGAYPAIFGFSGISIWIPKNGAMEHLYAGFALNVNIGEKHP